MSDPIAAESLINTEDPSDGLFFKYINAVHTLQRKVTGKFAKILKSDDIIFICGEDCAILYSENQLCIFVNGHLTFGPVQHVQIKDRRILDKWYVSHPELIQFKFWRHEQPINAVEKTYDALMCLYELIHLCDIEFTIINGYLNELFPHPSDYENYLAVPLLKFRQ